MEFVLILLALAFAAFVVRRSSGSARAKRFTNRYTERRYAAVERHITTLAKRRRGLVYVDDYGRERKERWYRELRDFVKVEGLMPKPPPGFKIQTSVQEIIEGIDRDVLKHIAANPVSEESAIVRFTPSMSPQDYENLCASILMESGWQANATVATGDQGVDVIAEKSGVKVAIQCKLYSSPVGNKAVREVVAGRMHCGARYAVVVTNAGFTTSARELAQSTDTLLLHHEDPANLTERIGR